MDRSFHAKMVFDNWQFQSFCLAMPHRHELLLNCHLQACRAICRSVLLFNLSAILIMPAAAGGARIALSEYI